MKKIDAVKAALAACVIPEHRVSVVLVPCWRNGFFGSDPFKWAALARAIGSDLDEVMDAKIASRKEVSNV
jgi:hypothetical protein